jgi:hypothetical protein
MSGQPLRRSFQADVASVARMWNGQGGGKDNFAADRLAVDEINSLCAEAGIPDGRDAAGRTATS